MCYARRRDRVSVGAHLTTALQKRRASCQCTRCMHARRSREACATSCSTHCRCRSSCRAKLSSARAFIARCAQNGSAHPHLSTIPTNTHACSSRTFCRHRGHSREACAASCSAHCRRRSSCRAKFSSGRARFRGAQRHEIASLRTQESSAAVHAPPHYPMRACSRCAAENVTPMRRGAQMPSPLF